MSRKSKIALYLSSLPVLLLLINCSKKKEFNEIIGYSYNENENALLWEISGNGLKQPSFLYGTIHIQRKEVFNYDSIVNVIFDTCAAYAMELNMDEISPFSAAKKMMMDKDVRELISPEKYRILDSIYMASEGKPIGSMGKMKPFFLMSQMMMKEIGGDMPLALDLHFFDRAKDQDMKVIGIEKFEEQMAAIDVLTVDEQVDMIIDGYKDTSSSVTKFEEMIQTYLGGDLNGMAKLTEDPAYPEKFSKVFLWDRNIVMADRIAEISKEQMTFNAVGAGHLGGDKGVIALLRKKGYTLKPIKTVFKN